MKQYTTSIQSQNNCSTNIDHPFLPLVAPVGETTTQFKSDMMK